MNSQPLPTPSLAPDPKRRLKLWIKMIRTTKRIENSLRDRLRREFNETMPRFDVMAALYRQPDGIKMSDLSRSLMVSNGNVTPIVEKLVQSGIVTRVQPPDDRRSLIVSLSEAGNAYFTTMAIQHQRWVDELFESLSAAEIESMDDHFNLLAR